jgi:hypothetical protein
VDFGKGGRVSNGQQQHQIKKKKQNKTKAGKLHWGWKI